MAMVEQYFPWQLEALPDVIGFVAQRCQESGCSERARQQLELAIDELFTNSVMHNRNGVDHPGSPASFRIRSGLEDGCIWFELRDPGEAFDPTAQPPVPTEEGLSERTIGGLGLHFVRKSVTKWRWRYQNGCNLLTLWKALTDSD
ncbi:ATP-binding protein [Hydrogenovibrio halophilus]|uniref:ATP-binding protein n=1 Tax=Hydrogenovibrio halophilus TaxID=373391 RepID=UPI00036BDF1F|nr:ATP-binding protein [Hydrogenovibrio halophilus]